MPNSAAHSTSRALLTLTFGTSSRLRARLLLPQLEAVRLYSHLNPALVRRPVSVKPRVKNTISSTLLTALQNPISTLIILVRRLSSRLGEFFAWLARVCPNADRGPLTPDFEWLEWNAFQGLCNAWEAYHFPCEQFQDIPYEYNYGWWIGSNCEPRATLVDMTTLDILACRDVPSAVVRMQDCTNSLDPIDVVFRNMMAMIDGYNSYSNKWDDVLDEDVANFRNMSAGALAATSYVLPAPVKFMQLPAELWLMCMHEYLLVERQEGRIGLPRHYDEDGNPCCMWEYPDHLVACEQSSHTQYPEPRSGECPLGWLPPLAFMSPQVFDEVIVFMLQKTTVIED